MSVYLVYDLHFIALQIKNFCYPVLASIKFLAGKHTSYI